MLEFLLKVGAGIVLGVGAGMVMGEMVLGDVPLGLSLGLAAGAGAGLIFAIGSR
jgi:hypothetical protein